MGRRPRSRCDPSHDSWPSWSPSVGLTFGTSERRSRSEPLNHVIAPTLTIEAHPDDRVAIALVATIDELFSIDAQAREQNLSVSECDQLRQQKARAILESIKSQIEAGKGQSLPKSAFAKACNYTLTFWPRLTRFLDQPILELSNNAAENAIRPIALGRKNWIHFGSQEAGPRIAAILSVAETCRRWSLADPHSRLSHGYLARPSRPSDQSGCRTDTQCLGRLILTSTARTLLCSSRCGRTAPTAVHADLAIPAHDSVRPGSRSPQAPPLQLSWNSPTTFPLNLTEVLGVTLTPRLPGKVFIQL